PPCVGNIEDVREGKFPRPSYMLSSSSSTLYSEDVQLEPKAYTAETLPLNLSCKRDSYGESCPKLLTGSNSENQNALLNRGQSLSSDSRLAVPQPYSLRSDHRPRDASCSDLSLTPKRESSVTRAIHSNEQQPCIFIPRADTAFGDSVGGTRVQPRQVVTETVSFPPAAANLKFASGVIRELHPVGFSDSVSPTESQASSGINTHRHTSSTLPNSQQNIVSRESSSVLVLPQPPMKRLRTMDPMSSHSSQPSLSGRPFVAREPLCGGSTASLTSLDSSLSTSVPVVGASPPDSPPKKQEEYVSVPQSSVAKSINPSDSITKPSSSHALLTQKFKFIPIKTEILTTSEEVAKFRNPLESAPKMTFIKAQNFDIKSEAIKIKTSPRSSTEDISPAEDTNFVSNPILSSAFLANKATPQALQSVSAPHISPVKVAPSGYFSEAHSVPQSSTSQLLSPTVSTMQASSSSDQKTYKLKVEDEMKSYDQPSQSALSKTADRTRSCNSPAVFLSQCLPSQCSSPGYSPTSSAPATTNTTSTSSTSPGSSTVAAADGSTAASQRVSINMRTFKEEWRRQLLVDYDARTNMSICMLCFTTFKSYDGPRKNTYVKHAKRFHPTLDKFDEHERDVIIQSYEKQFKYDHDMQKEVNKTFKCGGISSGATSGRLGKVWRTSASGSLAVNASSGSSTGSGSLPGSRPDTDGEEEGNAQQGSRRSESPDSDGSGDQREGACDITNRKRVDSGNGDLGSSSSHSGVAGKLNAVILPVTSSTGSTGRPVVACCSPQVLGSTSGSLTASAPNSTQNSLPLSFLPGRTSSSLNTSQMPSLSSPRLSFASTIGPSSSTLVFANVVPCPASSAFKQLSPVTTQVLVKCSNSNNNNNDNETPLVGKIGLSIVENRQNSQVSMTNSSSIPMPSSLVNPMSVPIPASITSPNTSIPITVCFSNSSSSNSLIVSR
ncbi:hypothetical protein FHG87_003696, partial [Trinorchestia longiramus]